MGNTPEVIELTNKPAPPTDEELLKEASRLFKELKLLCEKISRRRYTVTIRSNTNQGAWGVQGLVLRVTRDVDME